MANVYVWKVSKSGVGHISLMLPNGTYISHWPEDHKGPKPTRPKPKDSLENDIKAEGRNPDQMATVPAKYIDTDAICEWWAEFKRDGSYNLVTSNCAHVVSRALQAGLFLNSFVEDNFIKLNDFIFGLKTPLNVFKAVQVLAEWLADSVNENDPDLKVLTNSIKMNFMTVLLKTIFFGLKKAFFYIQTFFLYLKIKLQILKNIVQSKHIKMQV